jgi:hypothetical protein
MVDDTVRVSTTWDVLAEFTSSRGTIVRGMALAVSQVFAFIS